MQQEQAGVSGDEHSDCVGDFLSAAAFEVLLGEKDPEVPSQLLLVGKWKPGVKREALQQEFAPGTWERLAA